MNHNGIVSAMFILSSKTIRMQKNLLQAYRNRCKDCVYN